MDIIVATNSTIGKRGMSQWSIDFGPENILFDKIQLSEPFFDKSDPKNYERVLVKVSNFSCNFRDKGVLLKNYHLMVENNQEFLPFGSEFSGEIIAQGKNVFNFSIGQKVMGRYDYPYYDKSNSIGGIVTNTASAGWLFIHQKRIAAVPNEMSSSDAACWALGAQTAASMIRKSGVLNVKDPHVAILSGHSATSMMLAQQLNAYGVTPILFSSSIRKNKYLENFAMKENSDFMKNSFTHVFDPFFDINLENAISMLDFFGVYVTCGLANQHPYLSNKSPTQVGISIRDSLVKAIVKNLSIVGNCLGTSEDFVASLILYNKRLITPLPTKIFSISEVDAFINYSFFDSNKIGKCVLNYS